MNYELLMNNYTNNNETESIAQCRDTAYSVIFKNLKFENRIVANGCLQLPPTTTASTDYYYYDN